MEKLDLAVIKSINKEKTGFFWFKKLNSQYLLTNNTGEYCFLEPLVFESFLNGTLEQNHPDRYPQLQKKGFIRDKMDFAGIAQKIASKNISLGRGTSLHIVVVTLRCDHKCIYCQAKAKDPKVKGLDMDIATAEKVVDRIFESPNQDIAIEFQGGEPLINWETMKFISEYAREKNKSKNKRLLISLVSNLTFMTEDKLDYLMKNNIGICTSLDGPESVHNAHRLNKGSKNSYRNAVQWIKRIKDKIEENKDSYKYRMNALTTVTKFSLSYSKEIIDEFINLGLEGIHLRPVSPFGITKKTWQKLSFSPGDFLDFYKQSLDYIIKLNREGKLFYERTAKIFAFKILTDKDPNFLDIRSPCGAGIGQLAYNYNGDVYTCDEARMLAAVNDKSFKVGNVKENHYKDFINSEKVKTLCLASCLDTLAGCSDCVYQPYCGVCPVYNYILEGNIFSKIRNNPKCKIHAGILDYIFCKLQDEQNKEVFLKWFAA